MTDISLTDTSALATRAATARKSGAGDARFRYTALGAARLVLGKALYEGILVGSRLADFFLRKLLGRGSALDDLASLDPALHASMAALGRPLPAGVRVEDLGLFFELTEEMPRGAPPRAVPLLPGGGAQPVTGARVAAFVRLAAQYRLSTSIGPQTAALLRGFRTVIPLSWIKMFGPAELQRLLCGDEDAPVDIADLRAHCEYGGGLHPSQPYVAAFWRVLAGLDEADKRAFLAFVTSVARPPLLGFVSLVPRFGIQGVRIERDGDKLPSAATCFSLLKLPVAYSSEAVLREKLLTAIRSGAGFELT